MSVHGEFDDELKTDISRNLVDLGDDWEVYSLKSILLFFDEEIRRLEKDIKKIRKETNLLLLLIQNHTHDKQGRAVYPIEGFEGLKSDD